MHLSDVYLIWSNEHGGWWGPGRRGYSTGIIGAGEYTRDEAIEICRDALPTAQHIGRISEIPVRREDVMEALEAGLAPSVIWRAR